MFEKARLNVHENAYLVISSQSFSTSVASRKEDTTTIVTQVGIIEDKRHEVLFVCTGPTS